MGTLSYTATVSLDGYVADADGASRGPRRTPRSSGSTWTAWRPSPTRCWAATTYALMEYWQNPPEGEESGPDEQEFARRWQAIPRTLVSSTMTAAHLASDTDRLVPRLDPGTLRRIVDEVDGEVEIFGPTTAAEAIRAGMVSDFLFFVVPHVVGGGLRALPPDARLDLELAEQRVFGGGTVFLHYRSR